MNKNQPHIPVMLKEVIACLKPFEGATYVDATFGAGGYSKAILDAANCNVLGIDRDPNAVKNAKSLEEKYCGRLKVVKGNFSNIKSILHSNGVKNADGVVFDFGVSSMQLDQAERGFSFSHNGKLDMRMSEEGLSAADVVNKYSEKDLADIIYKYGEEKKSRVIASKIFQFRKIKPFETTKELADLVRDTVKNAGKIDPATKTFQALRIFVNDELGEIEKGLNNAQEILNNNGKIVAVSFHSLEDRIVKETFAKAAGKISNPNRYLPQNNNQKTANFKLETKKPLIPSEEELKINNRARSAKLRCLSKIGGANA